MKSFVWSRRRSVGAVSLAVALALLPSPAAAGSRAYRVSLSGMVILPPDAPRQSGEERVVRPGDIVLRAPLGWGSSATIDTDLRVEIAGVAETIAAGARLMEARERSGGDLGTLSDEARVFCADERVNVTNVLASSMTLGLSNLATRVSRLRRFCFVDGDRDGRLERAFLVGTKRDEDRRMVDISPTPYTHAENRPIGEGHHIELVYDRAGLFGVPGFRLGHLAAGSPQPVQTIFTGVGEDRSRTRAATAIRTARIPQLLEIGPASLTVTRFDPETKEATIRYERDFSLTPVAFLAPPQTTYIFVPVAR